MGPLGGLGSFERGDAGRGMQFGIVVRRFHDPKADSGSGDSDVLGGRRELHVAADGDDHGRDGGRDHLLHHGWVDAFADA